jgi:hypothetical protein
VRSGCHPHTHSASKQSWRSVAANIATVIGARTPAGSAPRMLVIQGPTRLHRSSRSVEIIPCCRLAAHLRGRRPMSPLWPLPGRRTGGGFRHFAVAGAPLTATHALFGPMQPLFERAGSENLHTKDKWSFCLNPA